MSKPLVLEMDFQSSNECVRGFNNCCCNWGVKKTPYDNSGNLKGKTAPLWINPFPKLFLALFLVSLLATLLYLAAFVVIEHHPNISDKENSFTFDPSKKLNRYCFFVCGGVILFANTFLFLFLLLKEYASDEEWFRYFILLFIFFVGMVAILVCTIIFTSKNLSNRNDFEKPKDDKDFYLIYVILAIIGIIFQIAAAVICLIVHIIMFKKYIINAYVDHSAYCDDEDIIIMQSE